MRDVFVTVRPSDAESTRLRCLVPAPGRTAGRAALSEMRRVAFALGATIGAEDHAECGTLADVLGAAGPLSSLVCELRCDDDLHTLPWERIAGPDGRHAFGLRERWLIRGLEGKAPPPLSGEDRVRILLAASRWRCDGLHRVDRSERARAIQAAIESCPDPSQFRLELDDSVPALTRDTFRELLVSTNPHILHLLGHGDPSAGSPGFRLEDGTTYTLDELTRDLASVDGSALRFLVLEYCFSLSSQLSSLRRLPLLGGALGAAQRLVDEDGLLRWRRFYQSLLTPGDGAEVWRTVRELRFHDDEPREDVVLALRAPRWRLIARAEALHVGRVQDLVRRHCADFETADGLRDIAEAVPLAVRARSISEVDGDLPAALLGDAVRTSPRGLAVLGAAGAGKTTALHRLVWELSGSRRGTVFWLEADAVADWGAEGQLEEGILRSVGRWPDASALRSAVRSAVRGALRRGPSVLVVDGVARARDVGPRGADRVAALAAELRVAAADSGGQLQVVVAGRDPADLRPFTLALRLPLVELQPLDPRQVRGLVRSQLPAMLADRLLATLLGASALRHVARTPRHLVTIIRCHAQGTLEGADPLGALLDELVDAGDAAALAEWARATTERPGEPAALAKDVADEAVRRGLLRRGADGRLGFAAGAYRDRLAGAALGARSATALVDWVASFVVQKRACTCVVARFPVVVEAGRCASPEAAEALVTWLLRSDDVLLRGATLAAEIALARPGDPHLWRAALAHVRARLARSGGVDRLIRRLPGPHPRGLRRLLVALIELRADLDSNDPGVVRSAIHRLATLGAVDAVEHIAEQLDHPSAPVRAAAASALGRLGAAGSSARLAAVLRDPGEVTNVRCAAVGALGAVGATEHRPLLRELLEDAAPAVRFHAVTALMRLQDRDAAREIAALIQLSPDGRRMEWACGDVAAVALATFGRTDLCDVALPLLAAPEHRFRVTGARLVGLLGHRDYLDRIRSLLDDSHADVRAEAVRALGRLGTRLDVGTQGDGLIQTLIQLVFGDDCDDEPPRQPAVVRAAVAEALGRAGPQRYERRLASLAADPSPGVRVAAIRALGSGARRLSHRVAGALEDPHLDVQRAAAETLGAMGSARHAGVLASALASPGRSDRAIIGVLTGLRALPERARKPELVDSVAPLLSHRAPAVAAAAGRTAITLGAWIRATPCTNDPDAEGAGP